MTAHVFTVVIDRRPTDDELDALYAAGCDDAAFGVDDGLPLAEFDREAQTLADAIASAVRDIREHLRIDVPDSDPALVVANLVLQARQHRNRVAHLSALSDLLVA